MKRSFILTIGLALLATACNGEKPTTVLYDLDFDIGDSAVQSELAFASSRVVERRLEGMGETEPEIDIQANAGDVKIAVTVSHPDIVDILTAQLTEPFKLRFMQEAEIEAADIIVAETDGFSETGVSEQHVQWLRAEEEDLQRGRITVSFTPEGRELMSAVFQENVGQYIGFFVRDRLVAKLLVETDELKDDIIISEIPNLGLAQIFADDVNVGLHVKFSSVE